MHGLGLPGLRAVSKRIESTYIWQGGAGSARPRAGACPFAQCSKITTTCAPVNRFCRSFLWLSRMGKSFVTHCNAIVTGACNKTCLYFTVTYGILLILRRLAPLVDGYRLTCEIWPQSSTACRSCAAPLRGPAYAWGLSPRVRGNPDAGALGNLIVGSIKVSATQHRRGDGECTRPK